MTKFDSEIKKHDVVHRRFDSLQCELGKLSENQHYLSLEIAHINVRAQILSTKFEPLTKEVDIYC